MPAIHDEEFDGEETIDGLAAFAGRLADASRDVILPYFRQNVAIDDKAGEHEFDPVTVADRRAEEVMRSIIQADRPHHGIVGEEFGVTSGNSPYTWVLDPIDGTRAFIMGMPLWGTLIGLLQDARPIVGIMDQPFTGERFVGTADRALYFRGNDRQTMSTRATERLEDALLASTSPDMFTDSEDMDRFSAVSGACRMTRYGGDCYAYCMLASGHADLVVEAGLKSYDIVALIPIVEGAGGVVTTWDGGDAAEGGRIVASANPALHQKALDCLNA